MLGEPKDVFSRNPTGYPIYTRQLSFLSSRDLCEKTTCTVRREGRVTHAPTPAGFGIHLIKRRIIAFRDQRVRIASHTATTMKT
jgi:hypothetical protein